MDPHKKKTLTELTADAAAKKAARAAAKNARRQAARDRDRAATLESRLPLAAIYSPDPANDAAVTAPSSHPGLGALKPFFVHVPQAR
jgi:hypothetical protein